MGGRGGMGGSGVADGGRGREGQIFKQIFVLL